MDIASVYLNLVSLLGTEIEVEGYYFGGSIFAEASHHGTPQVLLPPYILNEIFPFDDRNIFPFRDPRIRFRGVLKQNYQREVLLDDISFISCLTGNENYQAIITKKS